MRRAETLCRAAILRLPLPLRCAIAKLQNRTPVAHNVAFVPRNGVNINEKMTRARLRFPCYAAVTGMQNRPVFADCPPQLRGDKVNAEQERVCAVMKTGAAALMLPFLPIRVENHPQVADNPAVPGGAVSIHICLHEIHIVERKGVEMFVAEVFGLAVVLLVTFVAAICHEFPRLSAIGCCKETAPVSHNPTPQLVDEMQAEQRLLGCELLCPRLSAVHRGVDVSRFLASRIGDEPTMGIVNKMDASEGPLLRQRGLSDICPCLAIIGGFQQGAPIADNPTGVFANENIVQVILRAGFKPLPCLSAIGCVNKRAAIADYPPFGCIAKIDFPQRFSKDTAVLSVPVFAAIVGMDDETFCFLRFAVSRRLKVSHCPSSVFGDEVDIVEVRAPIAFDDSLPLKTLRWCICAPQNEAEKQRRNQFFSRAQCVR